MKVQNLKIIIDDINNSNQNSNNSFSKAHHHYLTERSLNRNLAFKSNIITKKGKPTRLFSKNQKKVVKSILKSSKTKVEQKKNIIKQIIEDNLTLDRIFNIQAKNDLFLNDILNEAQISYENKLDNLFNEKMKKLNDINEKYDEDIFELKNEVEELEEKIKNGKENVNININGGNLGSMTGIICQLEDCGINKVYRKLVEDKNREINEIEKEYDDKYNTLYNNFIQNFEFEDLDERNMIYRNQMFEIIKTKINDVVNPINNRSVNFKLDSNNQK